jgi:hypothetical protein
MTSPKRDSKHYLSAEDSAHLLIKYTTAYTPRTYMSQTSDQNILHLFCEDTDFTLSDFEQECYFSNTFEEVE